MADTYATLGSVLVRPQFGGRHDGKENTIPDREIEIYPNAPLQLVAFEVRFPYAPALATTDGTAAIYAELSDLVPIVHAPHHPALDLAPLAGLSVVSSGGLMRMLDRRRELSIGVMPTALVVETTAYERYERFADVIAQALHALESSAQPAGVQRVGLRYVDEIRVPAVAKLADWEEYVKSTLIAGLHIQDGYEPTRTESQVQFTIDDRLRTVMRCGAMEGFVVDPNGILKVRRVETGMFFLIDLDSSWTADEAETPPFSREDVIDICSQLHAPVRAIFEASITDRLRDEVLRKEVTANE